MTWEMVVPRTQIGNFQRKDFSEGWRTLDYTNENQNILWEMLKDSVDGASQVICYISLFQTQYLNRSVLSSY